MAKMEERETWQFEGESEGGELIEKASSISVRGVLATLKRSLGKRSMVPLGHGDPSHFPSFRPPPEAEDAIVAAVKSGNYNFYSTTNGIPSARRAVAEYLGGGVPHELSEDDVCLTVGCTHAIEVMIRSLARPGANILLPAPGFPYYESFAACCDLEVRRFPLLPDQGWEADFDAVEALSDGNTVAIVVVNPGNPTGAVYSRAHLQKIACTARKLGILVIADEVYERLVFGRDPFVPMGVFGSIAPVVTLGSISKRWCVPGWRLGWIVTHDPQGVLKRSKLMERIVGYVNISAEPTTLIQGALPEIFEKTKEAHFTKIVNLLRKTSEMCYTKIQDIACLSCPSKPQGSMFIMVRLNVPLLDDIISDDFEFCVNLAKEESVILMPGSAVGLINWVRITFAIEPSILEDGLARIQSFCQRHSKPKL